MILLLTRAGQFYMESASPVDRREQLMSSFKILSLIMTVIFIAMMLFSYYFVAVESGHHDCCGDECPICTLIEQCVQNIKSVGNAITIVFVAALLYIVVSLTGKVRVSDILTETLVGTKVRLNY